ncbi:MAG: multicopper oxidase domain-containing protein [Nocardioidaceae bacterium]|nr:multicopper oxidase domain-containing protein [Nocardioidaceae bacterium]
MTDREGLNSSVSRRSLLLGTAPAAAVGGLLAAGVGPVVARGEESDGVDLPAADGRFTVRRVTLYAEPVGDGYGYGLAPGKASVPGPTLEMYEGEQLEVTLVNSTDRRVSIHVHGVDYDVNSDGTPMNDGCVPPGERRRYVWRAHRTARRQGGTIRPGSAGYWHYHDHCMGGEHGTEGIAAGLYAGLIVRRKGDLLPARRPFVVVMQDMSINGRMAPDTPTFVARRGERVEFVVIGHGNSHHTFHLHGHRWADTRTGNLSSFHSEIPILDNKTVGPADSFGFQVIAGEGVGPGEWMYHCHVQFHADGGMTGVFLVRDTRR